MALSLWVPITRHGRRPGEYAGRGAVGLGTWLATHAIARRLPGAFIQNSVGTTFHLTGAAAA